MREFMLAVKRWHFWVLCPLVLLLATAFWFMGVGALKKEVETNRNKINGLYNTVNSVRSIERHPNPDVASGMDRLIEQRREEVAQAWTEKYRQQTADDGTLTWPEELGEDFISQVRDLRPIEKTVGFPVPKDLQLVLDDRRRYQEHLVKELPKLAKLIGAKWYLAPDQDELPERRREPRGEELRGERMRGGQLGPSGEALSEQSMVEWSKQSQMRILAEHFPWGNDGITPGVPGGEWRVPSPRGQDPYPSLLEILYAQEDLWVLQALMHVIANTNQGATARYDAVVKEIELIQTGNAMSTAGRVERVQEVQTDAGMGMMGQPPYGQGRPPDGQGRPPDGQGRPPDGQGRPPDGQGQPPDGGQMLGPTALDPAEGRYVDDQYMPLSAEQLRQVMRDFQSVDPSLAYLAVAKRIPVRLRVKLNQTGLGRFLVQCANSPLTIEVRQLRINPTDDGTTGAFGGMRREGGDRPSFMPDNRSTGPLSNLTGAAAIDAQSTTDITVEIYGIIYIYNPVDPQVLGGQVAEGDLTGTEATSVAAAG